MITNDINGLVSEIQELVISNDLCPAQINHNEGSQSVIAPVSNDIDTSISQPDTDESELMGGGPTGLINLKVVCPSGPENFPEMVSATGVII